MPLINFPTLNFLRVVVPKRSWTLFAAVYPKPSFDSQGKIAESLLRENQAYKFSRDKHEDEGFREWSSALGFKV